MVQFALPANSRVGTGKTWPKHGNSKSLTELRIYRWNPDDNQNPRVDTYFVNRDDCGPMVLDALIWIKSNIDMSLAFRFFCRGCICGYCAMYIYGTNTFACTKSM